MYVCICLVAPSKMEHALTMFFFLIYSPATQSVVNSFSVICETLARTAPDEWWKAGGDGSDDDSSMLSDGDDSGRIA